MDSSINKSIAKGVYWITIGRYSALIVQFIVTAVLARYVAPSDYGVIGILNVFISLSSVFLDAGFSQALIQKGSPSFKDFATVFSFNFVISILLYFLLFIILPLIEGFYDSESLALYGRWLFLVIPISAIGIVQDAILQINLQFKKRAIVQVCSALISAVVGISAAINNLGIYSLVLHALSLNISKSLLLVIFTRWKFVISFSKESFYSMFPFGSSLLLTNLIKVFFNNIYTLIIGKSFSSSDVAYYNQAVRLEELSGYNLLSILISVSYPVFVKIRDDIAQLKHSYVNLLKVSIYLLVPIFSIIILSSKEIITIVYTSKWLPAVPYLNLLCLYGVTLPLHLINENILKVYGKGKTILRLEIFRRCCIIIAVLLTMNISVSAMLLGQVVSMIPIILVSMFVSGKYINYSMLEQFRDFLPLYLIGLLSFLCIYFLFLNVELNNILSIVLKILSYLTVYYILSRIFNLDYSKRLLNLLKKK